MNRISDFIKPVCLPKIGFVPRLPSAKDNFIVSGWGRTETGSSPYRCSSPFTFPNFVQLMSDEILTDY